MRTALTTERRFPTMSQPADKFSDITRGSPEDELLSQIDFARLPRHIAIIMDGNGRWAEARGLERNEGHRAGIEAVREVVRAARERGIRYLTLFAFSTENWNRPRLEVDELMALLQTSGWRLESVE